MNADQKLGVGLIIFCIIVWFYAIPYHIVGKTPKLFPRLVVFFILVPGILLVATRRTPDTAPRIPFTERKDLHKALIAAAFFLVYIAFIDVIGYFTSSFLAIMGFLYFFGERGWKGMVIIPAVILFFIYLVIERLLSFPLPEGMLY